jgi:hypothetical protein
MAEKIIIRGDSYGLRRPIYTYEFLDADQDPLDLRGYKVQVTFKPAITTIEADGTDTTAKVKHEVQFGLGGAIVYQNGLYLVDTVLDGIIEDRWTKTETAALPVDTTLYGDVQLTDPNGEVFTWLFDETVKAVDGLTHRSPV